MPIPVGTASYGAASAAFLFLFLLLITSWRGRLQGVLLAAASLATALWAAAMAYWAAGQDIVLVAEILETLRSAIWFAFLIVLLGYSRQGIRPLRIAAVGVAVYCGAVLVAAVYSGGSSPLRPDTFHILSRLGLSLIGMVLVEQLYRNVHPQQKWAIKFLCLALFGMFVCDFFLYSEALLFRRVNEEIWAARGVINVLVVPLLGIATSRNHKWSLDIFVSRNMLFHSTAILGAAIYLLVMSAAGYYIRYFGGNWGTVLQVTFLFAALQLLFVILFSGTFRARLKVFLSKNFFSYRYDYREEWLRFTRALSEGEPGVQLRERSIQAIADLVDSPGGVLWLAGESGAMEPAANWNMPMPAASASEQCNSPFCQFLEKRQWVVNLEQSHAQGAEGLEIPGWLQLMPRAWLVLPLILHERLLGFVLLARSKGRINIDWEVNDLLKTAGRQAASYLAQLEAAKALLVARQFESFNRLSAFVVHDLKNLIAQLSLLLSNSDKHKHKPDFQNDMLETVSHSVDKMKRLLFQLRGGYTLEPPAPIILNDLLRQAVTAKAGLKPAPTLEAGGAAISVLAHRSRLERVIGHLIQNAIEATGSQGRVAVNLVEEDNLAVVTITDSGCGMSDQFIRDRLFKPFETTKAGGMGIGTYEAQQYLHELDGRIEVASRESHGSVFRVVLPVHIAKPESEPGIAAGARG